MMKDLQVQSSRAIKSRWQMSLAPSYRVSSLHNTSRGYILCARAIFIYIYTASNITCVVYLLLYAAAAAAIKRNKWTRLVLDTWVFIITRHLLWVWNWSFNVIISATPFWWWWWWLNFLDYYEMSSFFLINAFNVLIIIS